MTCVEKVGVAMATQIFGLGWHRPPSTHITMHSMGEEEKIDGESPCYARYENLHKIDGRYLSGNTYYFISSHSRNRKIDIFSFLKFQTFAEVQRERTSVLNVLLYANIS